MRLILVGLIALGAGARTSLAADPPQVVEVPVPPASKWTEFKAAPGRQLILSAGALAKWVVIDDGCDLVPTTDGKTATFSAPGAGRYRVVCVVGAEPVRCLVIVGTPPEPGPGPGPGPGPTPPTDTLVVDIKAAFATDGGDKADLRDLAALYKLMVKECGKADYATPEQLNRIYLESRKNLLEENGVIKLPEVRKRCSVEIAVAMGADPSASLTADSRKTIAATFARLAKAVEDASK